MPLPSNANVVKNHRWSYEILAGVLAVVIVGIVLWLSSSQKKSPIPTNNASSSSVIATPTSYSDFSGTIETINGSTLTVHFNGVNTDGSIMKKLYTVTVAPTTEVKSIATINGVTATNDLQLTDLRNGESVLVSGPGNLAAVTSFIAKKVYAYHR